MQSSFHGENGKTGFGANLSPFYCQKDPCSCLETFWDFSPCSIHNKQCIAFKYSHSWGSFTLPEIPNLSSFHGKNGKTGFWANFSPLSRPKRPFGETMKQYKALISVIYMAKNALLPCQVTRGCHLLFPKIRLCPLSMAKWPNGFLAKFSHIPQPKRPLWRPWSILRL